MLEILLQYALPALIAGLFGWASIASSKSRDKKAADAAAEAARINEQFPGWQELVDENRKLRSELTAVQDVQSKLRKEIDQIRSWYSKKLSAVARILRQIADQWPTAHGPDISAADIAELEDTEVIPPQWIRR